jgi:hypothetical protein
MPGKARVHELAREFGVDSKTVLAKLREQGEFVRSAASTVEAPVARRLRAALANQPRPARRGDQPTPVDREAASPDVAAERHCQSETGTGRTRPAPMPNAWRRPRREWYRGEAPEGLTKYLLDNHVVRTRHPEAKPPRPPHSYFKDEVERARELSDEWAPVLFYDMTFPEILDWVRSGWCPPEHAAELHRAGVRPQELGWSYEDKEEYPLGIRLGMGRWTVEMVINEVERRRALQ